MVNVIAKSNSRTKSFLSSVAGASATVCMLGMLTGCVSLDLFGGDKVDKSLSTASVPNQSNTQTLSDDATIRNAVDAGVCDAVVAGTPIDLTRVLTAPVPIVRARYELREVVPGRRSACHYAEEVLGV